MATKDTNRRVVVTGMGAVTPLGHNVATFWTNLCHGHSGVRRISLFDPTAFRTRIAAEVTELSVPAVIGPKQARRMDRFALFGLTAALEAWQDAGLASHNHDPYAIGVLIGSSHGGEQTLLAEVDNARQVPRKVSPRLIPRMLSNMAAVQVALHLELRGPSFTIGSACATSAHAIGEAAEIIRRGDATMMVCGGTEACITPLTLAGDQALGALSARNDAPEQASRPFDCDRDGFVLGEGAGVLVLEERDHALQRGARIYAELVSYATTTDALHETHPEATGVHAARAIVRALTKAGLTAAAIDAIFAHATSTIIGDRAEAQALKLALGAETTRIPVTAIKAALGHLLGGAGATQAIAAIKALECQALPPIRNLEQPDPDCTLQFVTGAVMPASLSHVLSNSFGFGGHNVALLFGRHRD